jgi:8-oxo-dGTP diphosphatase
MAGLWEPPGELLLDGEPPEHAALRAALTHSGVHAQDPQRLFIVKQAFTHHRITVTVMQCAAAPGARIPRALADHVSWVRPGDLGKYPLTSTGAKILARLKLARIPMA